MPVLLYDHRCPGAQAYIQLAARDAAARARLSGAAGSHERRHERRGQAAAVSAAASRRCSARPMDARRRAARRAARGADRSDPPAAIPAAPAFRRSRDSKRWRNRSAKRASCSRCWCGRSRGATADFELVAGERRWRAAQRVGLHEVPVIIRALADLEALEIALVENLQREDLSPLEEAEAYRRLIDEFGRTQAGLAEAVGKSRSHVANTLAAVETAGAGTAPARGRRPDRRPCARPAGRRRPGGARRRGRPPRPQCPGHRASGARRADAPRRRAPVRATPTPSRWSAIWRRALGLRVTIAGKAARRRLTLHYASLDQLDRVLTLLRAE